MPQRDTTTPGAPCWVDLFTSDPVKARAFYGELFGWTSEDQGEDFGNYLIFSKDGASVAGGMRNDGSSGAPDGWNVYLSVADAEATTAAVKEHGGQLIFDPMEVPGSGVMAMLMDAGGAAVGMWQAKPFTGIERVAEAGTPAWFELHTSAYAPSVQFYRDVFGWDAYTMSDTDDFRYTTLGTGDAQQAGIMDATQFLPEGVPSHWTVYFGVDDADATVAKATSLGATVIDAPEDTPYGRLATLADPTGARFRIVQGPASS